METLSRRLKQTFGYDEFRPLQREIMEASLDGRDALAILPTGAGKSLCYQLPALIRDGLTVVVSPLIALMKDQVDQLQASGVAATFLNSTLAPQEVAERIAELNAGEYQLLYVAPERLMLPDFLNRLAGWRVTALAVDEAHCISEWGHDFRPEYRRIKEVRHFLPDVPVLALTATATERVREDILGQLELRDPQVFLASFNRPNLKYQVIGKSGAAAQICNFVETRRDESGIVYCQSRKSTETLAATLRRQGFSAIPYHAGLEPTERARNQDAFLRDEAKIVCATVAFGMGINKPNVRFVIHADLPKNIEGYYQETGRAGRDGLPADCLLLFSRADVMKYIKFLDEIPDGPARSVAHQQLEQMTHFAESDVCRRIDLLGYFGESWTQENCGACDHCLEPREKWDATVDVQKLLSCVVRIRQAGGFHVGLTHISEILTGGMSEKIQRWRHDQLSTHGIGKDQSRAHWVELGRQLQRLGLLVATDDRFPTVAITHRGMEILKSRESVMLTRSLTVPRDKPVRSGEIPCDSGLFERLRALRKELADAQNVPSYVVFSDVTLRHIARDYPQDDAALLRIPGVGEKKLADYGPPFLQTVREWLAENERQSFARLEHAAAAPARPVATGMNDTAMLTFEHFTAGKSVPEIAALRELTETTIETHLAQAVVAGESLDPRSFYSESEEQEMRTALGGYDGEALKPVYEQLEGRLSYGKIRIFRAFENRSAESPA